MSNLTKRQIEAQQKRLNSYLLSVSKANPNIFMEYIEKYVPGNEIEYICVSGKTHKTKQHHLAAPLTKSDKICKVCSHNNISKDNKTVVGNISRTKRIDLYYKDNDINKNGNGTNMIDSYLTTNNITFVKEKVFEDDEHKLPFDYYLPEYNTVIEYHGISHNREFYPDNAEGEKEYIKRIKLDSFREIYCKRANLTFIAIDLKNKGNIVDIFNSKIVKKELPKKLSIYQRLLNRFKNI